MLVGISFRQTYLYGNSRGFGGDYIPRRNVRYVLYWQRFKILPSSIFKSVPSEEEEDENIADEITGKPTVVRAAVHYQHS